MMFAPVLAALALIGQPAPTDDGPVPTAPKEARAVSEPALGLDEKQVEIQPAPDVAAETAPEPTPEPAGLAAAPAPVAEPRAVTLQQKTFVQGGTLQVVLGQRAVFRLDDQGQPVLDKVEEGQLAAAHPEGTVTETFAPPPEGQIAIALDGSAETRSTILKVWNETGMAFDYSAIALVMSKGKVTPAAAPVCAMPPRGIRIETWRRPVVAVGLGRFKEAVTTKDCQ